MKQHTKVRCTLNASVIMVRRYRPRKLFKFWLYHDLVEDTRLMEYIKYLHKTRQFATMIRNGLRLMWTLGEGDTSVLFELFPTLRSQFAPDNTALIEEFRQLLSQQQIVAALPATTLPRISPTPLIDDDQDTVVLKLDANAGANVSANFLGAAFGITDAKPPTAVLSTPIGDKPHPPLSLDDDDNDYVPQLAAGTITLKKMG